MRSLDGGGGVQAGLRRLQARMPNAELRTIPGAGHSLVSEAFETLVAAILEWFDGAGAARVAQWSDEVRGHPPSGPVGMQRRRRIAGG